MPKPASRWQTMLPEKDKPEQATSLLRKDATSCGVLVTGVNFTTLTVVT